MRKLLFVIRNPYREHEKTEKQKERAKFAPNSILERLKSCSVPDLLTFCVKGKGKCALSKGDLLVCLTQGYSNLLQELFFCDFFVSFENIYNEVGPEQQKK